jgi:hypothetical protein
MKEYFIRNDQKNETPKDATSQELFLLYEKMKTFDDFIPSAMVNNEKEEANLKEEGHIAFDLKLASIYQNEEETRVFHILGTQLSAKEMLFEFYDLMDDLEDQVIDWGPTNKIEVSKDANKVVKYIIWKSFNESNVMQRIIHLLDAEIINVDMITIEENYRGVEINDYIYCRAYHYIDEGEEE